jgi:DNA-binding GntR family transcriptional regulator
MAERAFARPRTMQEEVLGELRRRILAGEIPPGGVIRPDQVAAELEVSRVPVREALRILEGEGVVAYRAHHGSTLASLRADDLREIYRIRRLLERDAIEATLPRLTAADVAAMEASERRMQAISADDLAGLAEANRAFHFALLDACGMPHLLRIVGLLWNATDHYRTAYYRDPANREVVRADHGRILDAARARDRDALLAAVDDHRDHAIAGLGAELDPTEVHA